MPLQRLPVQHSSPDARSAGAHAQRRRRGSAAAPACPVLGAIAAPYEELVGPVEQHAVHQPGLQLLEQHLAAVPQEALRARLHGGRARVRTQAEHAHDGGARQAAALYLAHQGRCLGQQRLPLQQHVQIC